MESLIEHVDLVLIPSLLRKLRFAHGLTIHSASPRGKATLGLEETRSFADREVPRYLAAIENGTALRRLTNVEAIFVVANLGQLQGPEALSTFASLIVPPGYSVDRSTLDELAGSDVVAHRISQLPPEAWPEDPYVFACLKRLRAAAKGLDPMFDSDDDDEPQVGNGD